MRLPAATAPKDTLTISMQSASRPVFQRQLGAVLTAISMAYALLRHAGVDRAKAGLSAAA
jgi:hypothetical protein